MSSTEQLATILREWSKMYMHRSGRDFKRSMDETGLSFSQFNVLMRLFHGKSAGVSEIGEELGVTNAAASQAVDRLVQMHLIERTEYPADRRAKRLALTSEGRALIEERIDARSKWIGDLTNALTHEQQEMIISAFTLLNEAAHKIEG